jgi:uncharacterized protein YdhG (YjbR/CyaY superfamily)
MKIEAKSAKEYVAAIPAERRPDVEKLRALVKASVPAATEGIMWGMIGYTIGGRPFTAIASRKSYLSLHLMDLYTQPGLRAKHEKALAKLKMGKGCLNFSSVDELPLDTISAILRAAPDVVLTFGTMAGKSAKAAKKTPAKKKAAPRSRA